MLEVLFEMERTGVLIDPSCWPALRELGVACTASSKGA